MMHCTIDAFSHGVRVTKFTPEARRVLNNFCLGLIQYELRKVQNEFIREKKRVFAARTADASEFRFSRHQLDDLIRALINGGIPRTFIQLNEVELFTPQLLTSKMDPNWVARENQVPIIEYITAEGRVKTITLQTGQGKALVDDTPVKVPYGWKRMGDIKTGDMVISADGSQTLVTAVYPQGMVPVYKLTFTDGRFIETCGEHLWKVYNKSTHKWSIISTNQIIELMDCSVKLSIPLTLPEQRPNADLFITPNQIGTLLKNESSWVINGIEDIFNRLSSSQCDEVLTTWLGIKCIGQLFLTPTTLVTKNKEIATKLIYLVRSMGGIAESQFVDDKYSVTCRFNHGDFDAPFGRLDIVSAEYVGNENATCITIDHPSALFVAKDFIVTHNTATSLKAAELCGHRVGIIVLGRYFDKWIGDVGEAYALPKGKLLTVRGFIQLKALLQLTHQGDVAPDFIIITSTSIQEYLKCYEETRFIGQPEWMVPPEKLYEFLGIGYRIIDEVHQHFHLNFKMDLYTHIPKGVYLSATLESDDPFMNAMYRLAYPMDTRMNGGAYIRYANVTAVEYQLQFADRAKYKRSGNYNHIVLEEWMMKKPKVLENYFELVYTIFTEDYLKKKKPGQRCLIFAASVEMCKLLAAFLKKRHPELKIGKYTSEDDYQELLTADVSVSTIGSAGTAVDIADLITVIMTTAVSEPKANLQALGRLRMLKNCPDQTPHFIYLVCMDITKHKEYHKKKQDLFRPRVLLHRSMPYPKKI